MSSLDTIAALIGYHWHPEAGRNDTPTTPNGDGNHA
jgi:hypothetical protein